MLQEFLDGGRFRFDVADVKMAVRRNSAALAYLRASE
jgi:hypothetical protein